MLILSRRLSESIMIGDNIKLTIVGMKNNQVQCGFEAPSEVTIHREEVAQRIRAEKEESQELPTLIEPD